MFIFSVILDHQWHKWHLMRHLAVKFRWRIFLWNIDRNLNTNNAWALKIFYFKLKHFFTVWIWLCLLASLCWTFATRNPTYCVSIGHSHYVVREFHFNHIVWTPTHYDWHSWFFMDVCRHLFRGMHFHRHLSPWDSRQNTLWNCRFLCQKVDTT